VTATKSRPTLPSQKGKQRSIIRWQHLLKREHPTGTERESLNYECGWKGGDRGGLAVRKNVSNEKKVAEKSKKLLTGIGLLMEGLNTGIWFRQTLKKHGLADLSSVLGLV
jgi:hypothetical protein